MKKSTIETVIFIREQLLEVSKLVTSFENKKLSAVEDWIKWLKKNEDFCTQLNFVESAELAGLRSTILFEITETKENKNLKRKRIIAKALETINPAQSVLQHRFKLLNDKIEMVQNLIKQILVPAKDAGIIQYNSSIDFSGYLETLLLQFKKHEQLAPSINNAIALIGKYDVLRILAEEIEFD